MSFQQFVNGISIGSVYALVAVGFALIFNILKFSNFSHGGVLTVTAYIGYLIAVKFKFTTIWIPLIIAAISGGIIAIIIEIIAFRRLRDRKSPLIYYFISSITVGIMLQNLIVVIFSSNFYSYPMFFRKSILQFGKFNIATSDFMMFVAAVVSLTVLMFIIYKTKLGVAIRALSTDVETTRLMGVNVNMIIMVTFFISGFLGGLSGVFLGINYTLYPALGSQLIVKGFIASVIGGLGNIWGAVAGAIFLGVLETFLIGIGFIGSGLSPVFIFMVLLILLIIRPQGIGGTIIQEKA